jgi:hypothetical protein
MKFHSFYTICFLRLVSKDGLRAYCHYLELFVKEGALRAQIQAKEDEAKVVEFDHLEQVFVQLLLDF